MVKLVDCQPFDLVAWVMTRVAMDVSIRLAAEVLYYTTWDIQRKKRYKIANQQIDDPWKSVPPWYVLSFV